MSKEYNSMSFDTERPEELAAFHKILDALLEFNSTTTEDYNDIHIKQEDTFLILEWEQVPYDHSYGGEFGYIGEGQVVMTEYEFPDRHYEYYETEEDYKAAFESFMQTEASKGRTWKKSEYNRWYIEEEQKALEKEIKKEVEEDSE